MIVGMNRFFSNSAGFSLVQAMVLSGVLAGTSLVATKLISDQKKVQTSAETRDKLEDLHMAVAAVMQNRDHCRVTMNANGLAASLAGTTGPLSLTRILTSDNAGNTQEVVNTTDAYINNSVKVQSITLSAPTGSKRNLQIVYRRMYQASDAGTQFKAKQVVGAKTISKTLSMRIQRDPPGTPTAGQFSACYSVTDPGVTDVPTGVASQEAGNDVARTLCNEMVPIVTGVHADDADPNKKAFEWDEANSICKPRASCPANQIYSGINSNGTLKCRRIEDWLDFNQLLHKSTISCPVGQMVGISFVAGNPAWNEAPMVVRFTCSPP